MVIQQLTIEHIQQDLSTTELSPGALADYRVYLAALYSLRAAEMQEILKVKASLWLDIRAEKNSDKAADREWQTTEKGAREQQLKWELKRIDKLSSAIASKLRVMENEARNIM
jgi:transposase